MRLKRTRYHGYHCARMHDGAKSKQKLARYFRMQKLPQRRDVQNYHHINRKLHSIQMSGRRLPLPATLLSFNFSIRNLIYDPFGWCPPRYFSINET